VKTKLGRGRGILKERGFLGGESRNCFIERGGLGCIQQCMNRKSCTVIEGSLRKVKQ